MPETKQIVSSKTRVTTSTLVGLTAVGLSMAAAMGFLMGDMYYENGGFLPQEEYVIEYEPEGLFMPAAENIAATMGFPIDNYIGARQNQRGTSDASVIYELLVEGEVTRMYTIHEKYMPQYIGPIRSLRTPMVEWTVENNGLIFHAGGSSRGLADIELRELETVDLLNNDEGYFKRDDSIQAPYNLYSDSLLTSLARRDLGLENVESVSRDWNFGELTDEFAVEDASTLEIDFSTNEYAVRYEYDAENGSYTRYNGGELHIDTLNGEALAPKNVIVQVVDSVVLEDGTRDYVMTGQGDAVVLRDGKVVQGTWVKNDFGLPTEFVDHNGVAIPLADGQIFVEFVSNETPLLINGGTIVFDGSEPVIEGDLEVEGRVYRNSKKATTFLTEEERLNLHTVYNTSEEPLEQIPSYEIVDSATVRGTTGEIVIEQNEDKTYSLAEDSATYSSVIVVQFGSDSIEYNGDADEYELIGSGEADVIQGGSGYEVRWDVIDLNEERFVRFVDQDGNDFVLSDDSVYVVAAEQSDENSSVVEAE